MRFTVNFNVVIVFFVNSDECSLSKIARTISNYLFKLHGAIVKLKQSETLNRNTNRKLKFTIFILLKAKDANCALHAAPSVIAFLK